MHHRHSYAPAVCLLLIVCGIAAPSRGELPQNIVTDAAPSRAVIDAYIAGPVKVLAGTDTAKWGNARTTLVSPPSQAGASSGFLDTYAQSLNAYLLPLTRSTDTRIRLNAAIVAARVAAKASNGQLHPVTLVLLKDQSDAVVLWALQTAKFIVPPLLAATDVKDANALGAAAVEAAKAHSLSGAVMEEAYRTVLLDPYLGVPGNNPPSVATTLPPNTLVAFLPNAIALYDFRAKLYANAPPVEPELDGWANIFLTRIKIWAAETPSQRTQVVYAALAQLKGLGQQNTISPSNETNEAIKRTGQAFQVVSGSVNQPAFTAAAVKVASVTTGTPPEEINASIATLEGTLKDAGFPPP